MGEIQTVALDMIDHFKNGSGAEYNSDVLTKVTKTHSTTIAYKELLLQQIDIELKKNGGDLRKLRLSPSIYEYVQKNANYPEFDTKRWRNYRRYFKDL